MGIVENIDGEPMTESNIRILGIERTFTVSKRSGYFKIILSQGQYKLQISCHEYQVQEITVSVVEGQLTNLTISLIQYGRHMPEVYQGTIVSSPADHRYVTDNSINEPFKGNVKTGIKGKSSIFQHTLSKC